MKNRAENEPKLFLLRHCLWTMQGVSYLAQVGTILLSINTQMACQNPNRSMKEIERRRAHRIAKFLGNAITDDSSETICHCVRANEFLPNQCNLNCKYSYFPNINQTGWLQSLCCNQQQQKKQGKKTPIQTLSAFSAIASVRNEMIQKLGILLEIVAAAAAATVVVVETKSSIFQCTD